MSEHAIKVLGIKYCQSVLEERLLNATHYVACNDGLGWYGAYYGVLNGHVWALHKLAEHSHRVEIPFKSVTDMTRSWIEGKTTKSENVIEINLDELSHQLHEMKIKGQGYQYESTNRQTGRTTRMLENALQLNKHGRAVYVLCTSSSIRHIKELAREICKKSGQELPSPIKFETVYTLGLSNIDWHNSCIHGANQNCVLLIDHHTYIEQFNFVFKGYHQFDAQEYKNTKLERPPEYNFPNLDKV